MEKGNVLVTGGAGYVGCILVPKLINKNYNVRVLDSMIFTDKGLDSVKDNCEIITGDIRDEKCLENCLKGIDYVIHLAAISNDPCSELNPEITKQVNYESTKKIVKLSKEKGIERFIYASSSSVYGIKDIPNVTEDVPLEPLTIYSQTKAWSEEFVRESNSKDFVTVNFRPATVCGYSPRMRLDLTVNILTDHAINKGKITVLGGDQKRPNVHIDDVTDCYIQILEAPSEKVAGDVFNFGYENHTVMEIANMVRKVVGKNVEIEVKETTDRRSYHISSEKIGKKLGIYPKKTIEDAVLDLKTAFNGGLIPNPSNSIYKNIERMKEIEIK